jgi:hypothetical protein
MGRREVLELLGQPDSTWANVGAREPYLGACWWGQGRTITVFFVLGEDKVMEKFFDGDRDGG